MPLKRRVFQALEAAEAGDNLSRGCDIFLMILIVTNVLAAILETVPDLHAEYAAAFRLFERLSVTVFTIEYALRIWSCTAAPGVSSGAGRLRFALSPLMLVDLVVLLPSWLGLDLRTLRTLRVLFLFRMGRYSDRLRLLGRVVLDKKEDLVIALTLSMVLLVLCSSGMYVVENGVQPEAFSSIPASMWWGVATLTTVGYGDVYPITPLGRFLGAIVAVLGIGMFALPAGILAGGFGEAMSRSSRHTCPKCGDEFTD